MPGRARRPADVAFAAAACIVLAGYNNLAGARPWHRRWYPAVNALAASVALGAAAASGLTASDLGLRRDRLRAGLRMGSAAAAPVVAAFGLAALTPATRPLLDDQRIAGLDRRQLAYDVLLRIPVGTVAWEEIAFRGCSRPHCAGCWPSPRRPRWAARCSACGTSVRPPRRWPSTGSRPAGAPGSRRHRRGGRDRGGGRAVVPAAGTLRQPGRAGTAAPGGQLHGAAGQYGSRPMKPSSRVWASASAGTSTRAPYWPEERIISSIGSIPAEQLGAEVGVEPVVLAGGAGEVPGVHEDVGGVELVDRVVQRHLADVRVARAPGAPSPDRRAAPARRRQCACHAATGSSSTDGPRAARSRRRRRGTRGTTRSGGRRRRAPSTRRPGAGASQSRVPRTRSVNAPATCRCRSAGRSRQCHRTSIRVAAWRTPR